jgi:hypothetical protein
MGQTLIFVCLPFFVQQPPCPFKKYSNRERFSSSYTCSPSIFFNVMALEKYEHKILLVRHETFDEWPARVSG